jgi:glycosyltransferase involved in cell wall biosynthesis
LIDDHDLDRGRRDEDRRGAGSGIRWSIARRYDDRDRGRLRLGCRSAIGHEPDNTGMSAANASLVTALVCTADRGTDVAGTVASILGNTYEPFELIVVDQSSDDRTVRALDDFRGDGRLRVLRSPVKGKGVALNIGLAEARGSIVVCTDDDCVVPPDWIAKMAAIFPSRPSVAVAFGNVEAAPHDPAAGFVPTYVRSGDRLVVSPLEKATARGIGACMAVRRDVVRGLGGFDPSFGPGSLFPSCDDWDVANRVLLRGHAVFETGSVCVVHHGFRTFAQGRGLARRDWLALGAVSAKPIRAGYWPGLIVALWVFLGYAIWPPIGDMLHLRRPKGLTRITSFVEGFAHGLRLPLDRRQLIYRPVDVASRPRQGRVA